MKINERQIALLHVAKGKLNLTDGEYRAALVHIGGVTSSTELDRDAFGVIMGGFEWMGFKPLVKSGPDYVAAPAWRASRSSS